MEHPNKKSRVSPVPDDVDTNNPSPAAAAPTTIDKLVEDCFQQIFRRVSIIELLTSVRRVCDFWNRQFVIVMDGRHELILHEYRPEWEEREWLRYTRFRFYFPRLLTEFEIQRDSLPWKVSLECLEANFRSITSLTICKESIDREYFEKLVAILGHFQPRLTSLKVFWISWRETDADFVMSALNSLFEAISRLALLTNLELFLRLPEGNYQALQVTIPSTVTFLRLEANADQKDQWLSNTLMQLVESNPDIQQIYSGFEMENLHRIYQNVAKRITKLGIGMDKGIGLEERVRIFSRLPSVQYLRIDHMHLPRITKRSLLSGIHALGQLEHVEIDLRAAHFFFDHISDDEGGNKDEEVDDENSDQNVDEDGSNLEFDEEGSDQNVDEEGSNLEFDEEGSDQNVDEEGSNLEFDEEGSDQNVDEEGSNLEFDEEGSDQNVDEEGSDQESNEEGSDEESDEESSDPESDEEGTDQERDKESSDDDHDQVEKLVPALSVRKLTVLTKCADQIRRIKPLYLFPNMEKCIVIMACDKMHERQCISALERQLRKSPQMKELIVNGQSIDLTNEASHYIDEPLNIDFDLYFG